MVGGRFKFKFDANYLVISLALAFVLYHVGQVLMGPITLASQALSQPAPVVQHKPAQFPVGTVEPNQSIPAILYGFQTQADQWPSRVVMPDVDIDLELTGSKEEDGEWEISEDGANFAINSAIPNGLSGNTVLFGHDRPALFRRIHDLQTNDEIKVQVGDKTYIYRTTGTEVVKPTDVHVFYQSETPKLTLITCDGWTSADRYIVYAQLDRVELK